MHDGSHQGGGSSACRHGVHQMLGVACSAGCDDRDGHGIAYHTGEREFVAVTGAVGVDGVDAQLARTQFLALPGPGDGVHAHVLAAAVYDYLVAGGADLAHGHLLHVHAHHDVFPSSATSAILVPTKPATTPTARAINIIECPDGSTYLIGLLLQYAYKL